jgi:hypothetical protein
VRSPRAKAPYGTPDTPIPFYNLLYISQHCGSYEPLQDIQMPVPKLEPSKDFPVPYDDSDEPVPTLLEELAVAGNTAELQHALGAPLEVTKEDAARQKRLLEEVVRDRKVENLTNLPTAFAAASFLRTYGQTLALDVASVRAAITTKLMEIADCGDTKFELKALELLGKHSDIGLFTERSEVTINYKSPEALEEAIKERVKRLLNADIIDVTPSPATLDDELGVYERRNPDADSQDTDDEDEDEDEDEDGGAEDAA